MDEEANNQGPRIVIRGKSGLKHDIQTLSHGLWA